MAGRDSDRRVVDVDGRRITLTRLDKVLYPATGFTKGDVLAYYAEVADALVPLAAGRPVTRKRWPDGVGTADAPGSVFFVKNLESHAPEWIERRRIPGESRGNVYPLLHDRATLTWLAQQATLEVHVPQWRFAPDGTAGHPDRLVLDLDPGDGAGLAECAEVARLVRPILADMGLDGGPRDERVEGHPPLRRPRRPVELRPGDRGRARARPRARGRPSGPRRLRHEEDAPDRQGARGLEPEPRRQDHARALLAARDLGPAAAAPRTWEELDEPDLAQLSPDAVLDRLRRGVDPLAVLHPAEGAGSSEDRLARYRAMRDPVRTPEPGVAVEPPPVGAGNAFVIQEHHARRLHWDFRLERDGVLVSWALPRGVPGLGERNHLAVHTEDHPLDYGSFEGVIPKGEYGGGSVSIWDAGTYSAEKWRDDEVIVTLTGRDGGGLGGERVRVALLRTGEAPAGAHHAEEAGGEHSGEQWLIHRMALESQPDLKHRPKGDPLLRPIAPMLASAGQRPMPSERWSLEMKWDGVRAIAEVGPDGVTLTSRNELDLTATYPEWPPSPARSRRSPRCSTARSSPWTRPAGPASPCSSSGSGSRSRATSNGSGAPRRCACSSSTCSSSTARASPTARTRSGERCSSSSSPAAARSRCRRWSPRPPATTSRRRWTTRWPPACGSGSKASSRSAATARTVPAPAAATG